MSSFPTSMNKNNSCRKNNHPVCIYQLPNLQDENWVESQFEPAYQRGRQEKLDELPAPGAPYFTNLTTRTYGNWKEEEMRKSLSRTASDNWLKMRKSDNRMYKTTSLGELCPPSEQSPAHKAPHIPEDGGGLRTRLGSVRWQPWVLRDYRNTWTSNSRQFEKPLHYPTIGGWYQAK
eukprot:TRINITY_DN75587_c0_g1_i1.p1 TRINITY_DN75587_c0_g1~~TRINITY_DN75587_c0_g1_i1.p1  ORF type:complete len:176 (-),score=9.98 TRINITY_DN75587_c0_g1_i1:219-746(-)